MRCRGTSVWDNVPIKTRMSSLYEKCNREYIRHNEYEYRELSIRHYTVSTYFVSLLLSHQRILE